MDEYESNIEIPDIDVIEKQIENIVDSGVHKQEPFCIYFKNMYKQLGFKNIFHDISEIVFILLIGVILLSFTVLSLKNNRRIKIEEVYSFIFVVSPLLYLVISLFSFFNAKQKSTFALEMTCKYNIYQIAALRMFIFSIVIVVCNTILILLTFSLNKEINILRALAISIMGLFLFSSMFLYTVVTISSKYTKYFSILGWLTINLGLGVISNEVYSVMLMYIPIYIHFLITGLCICLYIHSLKKFVGLRKNKKVF